MHKKTVMMAVGRTHRAWEQSNRDLALRLGIPESYTKIVLFLSRKPGTNQKEIAAFSNVTTAAVNQTVKEMQAAGYLRKETDAGDKRFSNLYLTEKGAAIAERFRAEFEKRDAVITDRISAEKEAELISLLDRIYTCIREELPEC